MLAGFYIQYLNGNSETKDIDKVNMVYWIVAAVFTIEGGGKQLGEAFNKIYWTRILNPNWDRILSPRSWGRFGSCGCECFQGVTQPEPLLLQEPTTLEQKERAYQDSFTSLHAESHRIIMWLKMPCVAEWALRCAMDWLVNSVARNLILYTVPILVCVEQPLDFVKDLTAVMFMTTLDDSDTKREVEEILVKLKYELYREGSAGDDGENDAEIKISLTDWEKKYAKDAKQSDKFELLTDLDGEHFSHFRGDPRPHEQERV